MALTITSRGTGTHNTGATTLVPGGRTATLAVGSLGVLLIALDNAGSGGSVVCAPTSWTDAKGNVWTRRMSGIYDNGAASAGIEGAIYTAPITTALLTTDLGTITWAGGVSPVAKAWTWYEVIPSAGNSADYATNNTGTPATAANGQITTGTIQVGNGVIAGYFAENVNAVTGDSDTTNGSWGAQQTATIGSGTSGVRIATQQKVQTTTASTQSYDVTVASQDRFVGYITVVETSTSVDGSGGVTIPAAAISGTGVMHAAGSGGVTIPVAAISGTGAEAMSGSGGVTMPAAAIAGTGAETFTGSGAITMPAPAISGSGTHEEASGATGSGGVTIPAPGISGTGIESMSGSGGITIAKPTIAGTAGESMSGSGGITLPAPAIAGTGTSFQNVTGTGAVTIPAPTITGTGIGGEDEVADLEAFDMMEAGSGASPIERRLDRTPFDDWTIQMDDEAILELYVLTKGLR